MTMSKSNFKVLRGARIIQQLDTMLDEASYAELENRTLSYTPTSSKRQHAVDAQRVVSMELVVARESGNLQANAIVQSDSGKQHQPQMIFEGVIFEDSDQNNNISFTSSTGDIHHIIPINLQQAAIKVRCTCLDFYYRFAVTNQQHQALLGDGPPPYQKSQTAPRGPANPTHAPGMCKHLLKLAIALKEARIVT